MKKQIAIIKTICFVFICTTILLAGCAPDTKEELPQEPSIPTESDKTSSHDPAKAAEDTSNGTITIYAKLFTEHTKGPVEFTHDNHAKNYSTGCNECHHVYENGKNIWKEGMEVKKCEVCHNEPTVKKEKSLPPDLQKKNLKLAFHNNCRACHRKIRADDLETKAPTTCRGCHKKNQ